MVHLTVPRAPVSSRGRRTSTPWRGHQFLAPTEGSIVPAEKHGKRRNCHSGSNEPRTGACSMSEQREVATLAGGCFWCLEAVYDGLRGVEEVVSGYMGGNVPNPSYERVCSGSTGHAEVVQ